MNTLIKYCLPYLFIFITPSVRAQTSLNNQYNYALSLYKNENYFDAVTEFKRLIFFDTDKSYIYKSYEYIGLCYKAGAKYSEAILNFRRAEINAETIDEIYNSEINIIRINILRRTTAGAFKMLDRLSRDPRFSDKISELDYWRGWAYIFSDEWGKAAVEFGKVSPDHQLKKIAEKVEDEKYSVGFAKTISRFIPGAGQIYTGHYLSGILSLGWNFLWGYISVNSFIDERIFDGLMTTNFLWLRFYVGNLQNAEKFAVEENLTISNQALEYLQHNYKGKKP